jgi:aryl sulfotransferase
MELWLGFATSSLTPDEIDGLRPLCDALLDGSLDEVRFRKIHDALRTGGGALIVPPENTRAAIYVVRDPRDVAVSWAHHSGRDNDWAVEALGRAGTAMAPGPDALMAQVRQHLGTWSDHVRSWTEHDLFPVLVVRYEDIHADPLGELRRLVEFAGMDASDERLAAAVESASFEALRAQEEAVGFFERPSPERPFFRSGRAGGWREELAPELAEQVERDHAEVMARLGYEIEARPPAQQTPRAPA